MTNEERLREALAELTREARHFLRTGEGRVFLQDAVNRATCALSVDRGERAHEGAERRMQEDFERAMERVRRSGGREVGL